MTRRALIFGVSGQDGAYLARLLRGHGYEVHGTTRGDAAIEPANLVRLGVEGVGLHRLDPVDAPATAALLAAIRPDDIYYLAAQSSVGRSFEQPIPTWTASTLGLVTLLDTARQACPDAHIVNAASGDCFGISTPDAPTTEASAFAPRSPYAAAKCAGAHAAAVARLAFGQHVSSAFLFSHESPLRAATFVTGKIVAAVRRIAAGSPERLALGAVDVIRDWGWAGDHVQALALMAAQETPRDLVIATGRSHRLDDLVGALFAAAGLDWRNHVEAGAAAPRPADIPHQYADPALAHATLGWRADGDLDRLARLLVAP